MGHNLTCMGNITEMLAPSRGFWVGFVELCAKILQIMRNDFKDYAHTFCQLCAPLSALYYTHLAFNIDSATLYLVYITNMLLHLRRLSSYCIISYRM